MDSFYAVYLIIAVASIFSVMGSLFILIIYVKYPNLQCFAFRLVVYLSLFNFFESSSQLIPSYKIDPKMCLYQSMLNQFFGLCNILWTGFICLILYFQICEIQSNFVRNEKLYLLLTLLISSISIIIPVSFSSFGYVGGNCWIKEHELGNLFRFVFFFIPAWTVIALITIIYIKIIRTVQRESLLITEMTISSNRVISKLKMYPIVMIVGFLPLTVYRIFEVFIDPPIWLYAASIGFYTCIGFMNAVVYGLNEAVKDEVFKTYLKQDVCISMEDES
ncbi:hypothetical protein SteCoe_5172 [Stentor coeruleus]|uniref:G-protein coupled receptors family 2 profile 2 domain-containing protein n=1 Tax=Stentor coeruleus TaxID=5963 RepID=A0A1R2CT71_9CILI|nr:hypothetical protein SteCoe_5172 [Stentor coeruleus]